MGYVLAKDLVIPVGSKFTETSQATFYDTVISEVEVDADSCMSILVCGDALRVLLDEGYLESV